MNWKGRLLLIALIFLMGTLLANIHLEALYEAGILEDRAVTIEGMGALLLVVMAISTLFVAAGGDE